MSQSNEFRKRGAAPRGSPNNGSSSSLPRPGFGNHPPRASPVTTPRTYSNSSASQPFPAQRSASYSSQGSVGARPAYPTSAAAYNPNAQSYGNGGSAVQSSSYASNGYGGYGNTANGYSNGLSSSSSSHHRSSNASGGMDDKYAKKPKRKSSGGGGDTGFILVVGGILLFIYSVFMTTLYMSKNSSVKSMLQRLDQPDTMSVINKVEELSRKLKRIEFEKKNADTTARNKVQTELNRLERSNKLQKDQHDELKEAFIPELENKVEKFTSREKAFMDQVGWLMDRTRLESKRMVLERFGPGPHVVEITFLLRGDNTPDDDTRHKFQIELAPLEKVPHAIHLFLEQVDHGLLEDTHFYLNGPHIVQTGPQPNWGDHEYDEEGFSDSVDTTKSEKISGNAISTIEKYERQAASAKVPVYDDDEYESYYTEEDYYEEDKRTKKYQDLGLAELAFPDYHHEYPHLPWTVGFTGRPGGPDWYINKVDNSIGHGPGGQTQHDLHEQGDACFGTISAEGNGRASLASHIFSKDVYGDKTEWHHFITRPVRIVHAEILTKNPILDKHLHLDHLHSQHRVFGKKISPQEQEELVAKKNTFLEDNPDHPFAAAKAAADAIANSNGNRNGQHLPHMNGAAEA